MKGTKEDIIIIRMRKYMIIIESSTNRKCGKTGTYMKI